MSASLIVTAADANYFPLLEGLIRSIRSHPAGQSHRVAAFDLGLTLEQQAWLRDRNVTLAVPEWAFDFPGREDAPFHFRALLARPYLSKYFPDADYILWLDADAWVQNWSAVDLLYRGAARKGFAIVPEIERTIKMQYGHIDEHREWIRTRLAIIYGEADAAQLVRFPMLNAGVFAYRRDAPHCEIWAESIRQALHAGCTLMTDQFALNEAMHRRGLLARTELLPAWCNWVCHLCIPDWDPVNRQFVEPDLPHAPIGIVHLTAAKHDRVIVSTTAGEKTSTRLQYDPERERTPSESPLPSTIRTGPLSAGDYVSPGLQIVLPDAAFPHLMKGDPRSHVWPYLRKEIPHTWYVDRRFPQVGFCNRDEAAILHNTARQFRNRPALEIGCWLGWSACHLALAGVWLDVVDPILAQPDFHDSVRTALSFAGVAHRVSLVGEPSPAGVETLARIRPHWEFGFIDGDHEGDAPRNDAIAFANHAAPHALVLFHDAVAPAVGAALDELARQGWQTAIYHTAQILGVAWRGDVRPVPHTPDSTIHWKTPAHLQRFTAMTATGPKV